MEAQATEMALPKFSQATPAERKRYLEQRLTDLKNLRDPWMKRWRDVSNYVSPYNGRFHVGDHQESRSYKYIYDNEAGSALNILTSGLASGATSPVRQWFKLVVPNPEAMMDIGVAGWCSDIERMLLRVFQISNTYNSLHSLYRELCLFGVGADIIYEDPDQIIRHHVLTAGEYCIQVNHNNVVDTIYREFQLTVGQAVRFFGYDNLSESMRKRFDQGMVDEWHTFCQAIEPREDRDPSASDNKNMPFASYYFQEDDEVKNKEIISESGFKYFPALCPRWDVITGEPYGISPAITALPNIKQLQQECYTKSLTLELLVNPPIQAPSTMRQDVLSMAPGTVSFTGSTGVDQTIKPIIAGLGDINAITQDIQMLKQDIKRDFFVDLFLMVQQAQDDRKTATEIYALKEEKMLVLGAVIERLQHELLSPLVVMAFTKLKEKGLIPDPPRGLPSGDLDLEFQSMLAQSQRAVDINAIDRMVSSMQAVSASMPEVIDRIDPDGLCDVYRDRLAVDPKIFRTLEAANEIRQQRAEAMAQQAQVEQGAMGAGALNQVMQAQKAGAEASVATQSLDAIGGSGEM